MPKYCFGESGLNKILDTEHPRNILFITDPHESFDVRDNKLKPISAYLYYNEVIVDNNYSILGKNDEPVYDRYKPSLVLTNLGNIYLYIPYCNPIHLGSVHSK